MTTGIGSGGPLRGLTATRRRWLALWTLMTLVALGAAAAGLVSHYNGDMSDRRAVLSQVAERYGRLVEEEFTSAGPGSEAAALRALPLAVPELGATAEVVVGQRSGSAMSLLAHAGDARFPESTPIPLGSGLAEPMQRALGGETGTMTGRDFKGTTVLAAYRWLPAARLGLVVKIDATHLRLQFLRSVAFTLGATILLVLAGSALFIRTGSRLFEQLQEGHARLEALFEHSPLSIWEEDFSSIQREFRELRASGITDIKAHLDSRPGEVARLAGLVRILDVNETSVRFFGAGSKAEVWRDLPAYFDDASLEVFREELVALANGATTFDCEIPIVDPASGRRILRLTLAVVPGHEKTLGRVVVSFLDVTQQKRSEAAVRSSEERHRHLVERLPAGVVVHAPDSSILFANTQASKMLGLSAAGMVGKKADDQAWTFKREDGTAMPVDEFPVRRVLATGRPVENLPVGIHDPRTGEDSWALVDAFPEFDSLGQLQQVVVTFVDFTARRRAEAEVAAISSVFRQFQLGLSLPDTFQAIAEDLSSTLRFPIAAIELYHAEQAEMEIVGIVGSPVIPAGAHVPIGQTISGTVASTGQAVVETRALLRTDYTSDLLRTAGVETFLCAPMKTGGFVTGTVALGDAESRSDASSWAAILTTVASTLAQEIARRQAEESLRASEEKYRRLHESMTDAFVRVDLNGSILEHNGAFEKMLGYSGNKLLRRSYLDLIPARWHERESEIETAQVLTRGFSELYEKEYRRKDGSVIPVEVRRFLVRESSGRPGTICAIVRDLSDRKDAEERQVRTQKMEALGTLAGGIAHDFNNILLAIRGNASLVAGALDVDHPVQPHVAEIEHAGKKAAGIVRQILSFARPQAAGRAATTLPPIVEQAASLLRPILPAQIVLEVGSSGDVPAAGVDPDDVVRAVMNLVTNSADAIGERSGKIEILLERTIVPLEPGEAAPSRPPGTYASLSVTDDGPGMAPETVARAFDPFFTMKEVGKGTGLGLSIVHGIMKGCGGSATIHSVPGEGTTVQPLFPASDQPLAPLPEPLPAAVRVRAERILFVDDDEALVFLARETLGRLGYDVTAFDDPVKALVAFRQAPGSFDAVVTDLSMPRMSGFDLARGILSLRPGIPVVLTSGYIRPEDEGEAERLGVRAVILKPNTVEEMGVALDRIFTTGGTEDPKG